MHVGKKTLVDLRDGWKQSHGQRSGGGLLLGRLHEQREGTLRAKGLTLLVAVRGPTPAHSLDFPHEHCHQHIKKDSFQQSDLQAQLCQRQQVQVFICTGKENAKSLRCPPLQADLETLPVRLFHPGC